VKRSFLSRLLGALAGTVVAVTATVVAIPTTSSASLLCVLEPQLADVTVSQGLSYSPLVRGKTALVRLHLSMPACAGSNDSIELRDASLKITREAGAADETLATVESAPELSTTYPKLAPFTNAPQPDWPGDPKFVVPGDVLRPASTTAAFDVNFEATLRYATVQNGLTVERTKLLTGGNLTAKVAPESNALRVLVVPMGDATAADPWVNEFPRVAGESAVLHALQAANRQLPVPDGVARITESSTAGLRYEYAQGMLDLGPVMAKSGTDKVFCGSELNFPHVKDQLAYYLQAWNSGKTGEQIADRVVGVVWHGIATGFSSCAEGWASLVSPESWVRIVPPAASAGSTEQTSVSGATMAMEIGHTFGLVPGFRAAGGTHSKSREADLGKQRAYNVPTRRYIADDKPSMGFALPEPWHSHNTLFEELDWDIVQCALTPGLANNNCTVSGTVGTDAGAVAAFVIAGTTTVTATSDPAQDETSAHSYFESGPLSDSGLTSEYTLVQVGADGQPVKVDGVPVRFQESGHVGEDHDDHEDESEVGLFDFTTSLAFDPANPVARIELRHSSRQQPLYVRQVNDAPVVVESGSVDSDPVNLSDPGAGDAPALTPSGEFIAYGDGVGNVVIRRASAGGAAIAVLAGAQPAWSHDGAELAYVRGGNVYVRTFDDSTGTLGGERVAYDVSNQQLLRTILPSADASNPTWSPAQDGGDDLAIQIGTSVSDIFVLDTEALLQPDPIVCQYIALPGDPCRPITRDGSSTDPAWSADNRIGFVQAGQISVHTVGTGVTVPSLVAGADPSWTSDLLLYVDGGAVFSVDGQSFEEPRQLTSGPDANPSASSDARLLAVERQQPDATTDVMLIDRANTSFEFTVSDEYPGDLRLDVFVDCDGTRYPAVVAAHPVAVDAVSGEASFELTYDYGNACPGGSVDVRFTDGFHTTWEYAVAIVPEDPNGGGSGNDPYPLGAIYSPTDGGAVLQYDVLGLSGTATDENGTVDDSRIRWRLVTPQGTEVVRFGGSPEDVSPGPGGWGAGTYVAILEVLTAGEYREVASSTFTIVADADRDGAPRACGDIEGTWRDAFADHDLDGLVNVEDPDPCVSANNVVVEFDPKTLYVPSSGNDVMLRVRSTSIDLATVAPSSVRISRAGAWYVDGLAATSWSYDRQTKQWVARFNRLALTSFLHEKGLVGIYVPIALSGTAGETTFRGIDPNYPVTSNNN
jgi:hypothetical protein